MDKKYKLIRSKENGKTVTRIKALRDGEHFMKGEVGGIVDAASSLNQYDESWVDFESNLQGTTVSGNVYISKKSTLVNSELINVTGRIQNTYLSDASLYGATVDISDSFIKSLSGTSTLTLNAANVSLACGSTMSGKVNLNDVRMETFQGANLPIQLYDVTIQHAVFKSPATVTDTFIYKSNFAGLMRIANSMITNSTIESTGGNTPAVSAPVIQCLHLVGSKARIADGRNVSLSTGICINDVDCNDLAEVMMTVTGTFTVVRVPENRWFIQLPASSKLDPTEFDKVRCLSSSELYDMLEAARGDLLGEALEIVRICIPMTQNEPSDNIRKRLKKIRRKLLVRWILRHFGL
jgi:hypothetical protein